MQWKAISKFYLRNTNRDECWTTFERQPTKLRANEKNYIFMILFQFSVDAHTCNRSLQWYIIKENHRMKPSYNEINAFKQWPNHGGMSLPNRNSVSFLSHNNVILIYMRRKEQCECLQIEKSKWPTKEKKNECCKIQIMVQPVKNRWLFMHATVNGFKNKYNFHGKKKIILIIILRVKHVQRLPSSPSSGLLKALTKGRGFFFFYVSDWLLYRNVEKLQWIRNPFVLSLEWAILQR